MYVDSHCHIDRYPHPEVVLRAAARSRVVTIAVTDTPSSFKRSNSMLRPDSMFRVAVGIHPLSAARTSDHDLSLFARLLDQTDYVGEVGLDYSIHGRPTRGRQTEIFERILATPSIREKVLTVHSRQAEADTVRLLVEARAHAILHWYQGALKHIDVALAAGMRFSVNTAMLSTRRGQRIIASLPPDRVLTETDGPYTRHNGRPNEPQNVPVLVAALAKLWNEDPELVEHRLFGNMETLYRQAAGVREDTKIGRGGPDLHGSVIPARQRLLGAAQLGLFARQGEAGSATSRADAAADGDS